MRSGALLPPRAALQRSAMQHRLDELRRTIDRGVDQLLAGTAPAALGERLKLLETEAEAIAAELEHTDEDAPVELHPAAAERYRRMVANLQRKLDSGKGASEEVFAEVRKLIERIEVRPVEGYVAASRKQQSPATITVYGALAQILLASSGKAMLQGNVGCGGRI